MPCLLGIDVGTSGTKAILIDESGLVRASSYIEYPLSQPQPGWAEQDPEQWWQAVTAAVQDVLAQTSLDSEEIAGVGLSGQMHGAVVLDNAHQVIRPAILWCDQRTEAQCDWIYENIGVEKLYRWTGNPALPGFTAPKLLWLKQNEPQTYRRISRVLLPKDYIRFRLTGDFATDASDASGTLLLDVAQRTWSGEMLAALDVAPNWLPPVYESPVVTGQISMEAAAKTGLKAGIPVVAGAGDQAAGAVGVGVAEQRMLSVALGTSGVVFAVTDKPCVQQGSIVHTFCHAIPGKWHAMGVMLSAGGALHWFRDAFNTGDFSLLTDRAAQVAAGADGLVFLPYLLGERTPYPDPAARGAFIGLTMQHKQEHLARAILEGVVFGLRDSLELLVSAGVQVGEVRVSGGGAKSRLWRQILADVFNTPVTTVNTTDGPAYGAALLAGVGVGQYPDVEAACATAIQTTSSAQPAPAEQAIYKKYYSVYQSLYPLLRDTMHNLP